MAGKRIDDELKAFAELSHEAREFLTQYTLDRVGGSAADKLANNTRFNDEQSQIIGLSLVTLCVLLPLSAVMVTIYAQPTDMVHETLMSIFPITSVLVMIVELIAGLIVLVKWSSLGKKMKPLGLVLLVAAAGDLATLVAVSKEMNDNILGDVYAFLHFAVAIGVIRVWIDMYLWDIFLVMANPILYIYFGRTASIIYCSAVIVGFCIFYLGSRGIKMGDYSFYMALALLIYNLGQSASIFYEGFPEELIMNAVVIVQSTTIVATGLFVIALLFVYQGFRYKIAATFPK